MQVKKTISSDVNISDVPDNNNKGKAKSKGSQMTRIISIVAILLLILGLSLYKVGVLPSDKLNFDSINKLTGNEPDESFVVNNATSQLTNNSNENEESQLNTDSQQEIPQQKDKSDESADSNVQEHKNSEFGNADISYSTTIEKEKLSIPKQAIAGFAPLSEDGGDDQEEMLNPYEIEIGKIEYAPTIQKHIVLKNATQYRMFLINARKMIEKFEKGEVYDNELRTFQMRVVPEEINEIIEKFSAYNEMLKDEKLRPYKKIDLGYKFFDRFLKIKEVNKDYEIVNELEKEIRAELSVFNKFLHSDRLQAEFFGK